MLFRSASTRSTRKEKQVVVIVVLEGVVVVVEGVVTIMNSTSTTRDIDALIAKRLNSSWGRLSNKGKESTGVLHRWISNLSESIAGRENNSITHEEHDQQWNIIMKQSIDYPEEVAELDRRGRSCLSAACAFDPPACVIESMMEACRFGIESNPDKTGHTALHIAIRNNASIGVIQALLRSPRILDVSDHRGNTALHLACTCKYQIDPIQLLREILQTAPHIVNRDNAQGKTALHVALEHKADLEMLTLLVAAAPESVLKKACGSTPLIVALQYNAPLPVYQLLVQTNPLTTQIKDDYGRYPLRCALEHRCTNSHVVGLLCSSPETVLEVDSIGRTPLHMMLDRSHLYPDICDILLDVAPQAARFQTKYSELPIEICYRRYSNAMTAFEYRPTATASHRDVLAWWYVLIRVLRASFQEESLLQAALATKASLKVMAKIIQENEGQIHIPDQFGRSPLSVACQYQGHSQKSVIVEWLLQARGSVATVCDLSWAAATGGLECHVLYQLVCACPEGLTSTIHSGLYPCLLAACGSNIQGEDQLPHTSAEQLSVIFTLILAAPDLIQTCLGRKKL